MIHNKTLLFIILFALFGLLCTKGQKNVFVENKNQITDQYLKARNDIKYLFHENNKVVFFKNSGVTYQLINFDNKNKLHQSYRVDIEFLNTNNKSFPEGKFKTSSKFNYYNNDNFSEAGSFEELYYENLYEFIGLRYYFNNQNLKYDFIVAKGGDYKRIKLKINGAKKIFIDKKGDLVIKTPQGNIIENKPIVFQNNKKLNANWILEGNVLKFEIDGASKNYPLIIDPLVRLWGTYSGGSGRDVIYYSKVDNSGNLYVSGYTNSTSNIATIGAFQNSFGGQSSQIWGDAYVTKYNASGVRIWSTYYGGNGSDFGGMINVDASGNVYLVGATLSSNTVSIATPSAHQTNYGGGSNTGDAFIVKLNSSGIRLWGTYFGGSGDDYADGAALDNSGNLYITGVTSSTGANVIATPGCFQQTYGGGSNDAFIAKFDSNGNRLWGTYFGGNGIDNGLGCNLDNSGNILIAGYTTSTNNITTPGSHQINYSGGSTFGDGFFAQFDTNGNRLYGSYYGGSGEDYIGNIMSNTSGEIFIAGSSSSNSGTNIATLGSYQSSYGGGSYDLFLAKFNSAMTRQWGTYYGGSGADEMGYCVLNNNSIYLSGRTTSASQSVLTTSCSYQSAYGGGFSDACLSKFNFSGFRIWSTLYGGSGTEDTPGISCNLLNDEVYLTGSTTSNNSSIISSPGAQQISYGGGAGDGFIAKFDGCPSVMPPNTTNPQNMQVCFNSSAILSTSIGCGIYWYSTPTGGSPLFSGSVYTTSPITNNTTYFIEEITCGSNTRTAVHLTVVTLPIITAISSNSVLCAGQSTTLTLSGANSYSINGIATNSISILNPTVSNVFTISGSNSNGCINSNTLALLVNPCTSIYKSVNNEAISIYPNPFFDIISLKIPSAEQENIEFIVVNELGKIVISQKIYKSNTSINCVYLSKGVYIAYILKNKHPIEIIKILK